MTRRSRIATATMLVAVPVTCLLVASSLKADSSAGAAEKTSDGNAVGLSAFREVASVLVSPRCLNCHVPGESPLQYDDSRPHTMSVKRGADGNGTPAMRCTNCHQSTNTEFAHAPPGVSGWRMPRAKTPLAWQGLSTGELCRSLKDPSKNGGMSLSALVEHVTSDKLVNWGWNPGTGRTTPPLPHQQFVDKFRQWVDRGAPCEQ